MPSGRAVARAVAPYGAFGFAYFCLVSLPQLVSGGAWLGRYGFNGSFSLASGLALVGLVPVAGFGTVAAERLMQRVLPATLAGQPIRSVSKVREALRRHWRAQLAWAALAGACAAAAIDTVAPGLGRDWLLARGLQASPWLLYACSAGFFFFAIGTFASTLLFSLSSPGLALAGAWAGRWSCWACQPCSASLGSRRCRRPPRAASSRGRRSSPPWPSGPARGPSPRWT